MTSNLTLLAALILAMDGPVAPPVASCTHPGCPCACHPPGMPPVPAKAPPPVPAHRPPPVAYQAPAPAHPAAPRNAACTTVYGADGRAYTSCPAPASYSEHSYGAGFRPRRGLFGWLGAR